MQTIPMNIRLNKDQLAQIRRIALDVSAAAGRQITWCDLVRAFLAEPRSVTEWMEMIE